MVKNPGIFPVVPWVTQKYILQSKAREKIILRKSPYSELNQSEVDSGMNIINLWSVFFLKTCPPDWISKVRWGRTLGGHGTVMLPEYSGRLVTFK